MYIIAVKVFIVGLHPTTSGWFWLVMSFKRNAARTYIFLEVWNYECGQNLYK